MPLNALSLCLLNRCKYLPLHFYISIINTKAGAVTLSQGHVAQNLVCTCMVKSIVKGVESGRFGTLDKYFLIFPPTFPLQFLHGRNQVKIFTYRKTEKKDQDQGHLEAYICEVWREIYIFAVGE